MISIVLALSGLILLAYRLWPRLTQPLTGGEFSLPKVSIIVPARNEEQHLPELLDSLTRIDYPDFEIIVVDDRSTDGSIALIKKYPVQLIVGTERPEGWIGKPWACHQASLKAAGDLLLFTDADTRHHPASLQIAVKALQKNKAHGLTALPYHSNPKLWERLLGPFHLLLIALTNPYGKPQKGRVFAIGQYLLFHRDFYLRIGGHQAIKDDNIDDLALAGRTLAAGGTWHVHTGASLYKVRMYESLSAFIKGWRRNFRGGMRHNSALSSCEVFLFFMAMTVGLQGHTPSLVISGLTFTLLALTQMKLGRFSAAGILLLPYSIILFTWISLLAVYDRILTKPLHWKNRSYLATYRKAP